MKTTRRIILESLTRARLLEPARFAGIAGLNHRPRSSIEEALAEAGAVTSKALLEQLRRDELKGICRALGLDERGREKAVLVKRILRREEERANSPAAPPPAARREHANTHRPAARETARGSCGMRLERLLKEKRSEILRLCAKHGAHNVRVFGSVARGEADEQSDIDLVVDFEPGRSLLDHAALWLELQELLGCKVDVVSARGIKPRVRERVQREATPL